MDGAGRHQHKKKKFENLKSEVNLIVSSKTVFLFGLGGSNIIAADAYHKLLKSPLNVIYASNYHLQRDYSACRFIPANWKSPISYY